MKHEYRSTGYIRTCCWNKIKHLFQGQKITKLILYRSVHERGEEQSPFPWVKLSINAIGEIKMDWDLNRNRVPFEKAVKTFDELAKEYPFKDYVVKQIQILVKADEQLIATLNKFRKEPFDEKSNFYITFVDAPVSHRELDGSNIDAIKNINSIAIKELGFKIGGMDLKHIHDENFKGYDELLDEHDVDYFIVRKYLDTTRWFEHPEIKQLDVKTYPGAIRDYENTTGRKWKLVSDTEVK